MINLMAEGFMLTLPNLLALAIIYKLENSIFDCLEIWFLRLIT